MKLQTRPKPPRKSDIPEPDLVPIPNRASFPPAPTQTPWYWRYTLAIGSVCAATALRMLFTPVLDSGRHLTFLAAVAVTALYAGIWPAMLALSLGAISSTYFFSTMADGSPTKAHGDWVSLSLYLGIGAIIAIVCERQREIQMKARVYALESEKARVELEIAFNEIENRQREFELITDSVPALLAYIDFEERYRFVNQGFLEWFGGTITSWLGLSIAEVLGADAYRELGPHIEAALQGEERDFLNNVRDKDGRLRTTHVRYRPDAKPNGDVLGFFVLITDVSETKEIERSLRQAQTAERLFRNALTDLHLITNSLSKASTIDELCKEAVLQGRQRLGFERIGIWFSAGEPNKMVGSFGVDETGQLRDERHSTITIEPGSPMARAMEGIGMVFNTQVPMFDDKREIVGYGEHCVSALWDGIEVIGSITIDNHLTHRPITENQRELLSLFASTIGHLCSRLRAQEEISELNLELAQRVEELEKWFEVIPIGLAFSADPSCRQIRANVALAAMLGMPAQHIVEYESDSRTYRFFKNGKELRPDEFPMQRAAATGTAIPAEEIDIVRDDGEKINALVYVAPIFDEEGKVRGALGAFMDMTDRRRILEDIHKKDERLTMALEAGRMATWDWDLKAVKSTTSDNFDEICGFKSDPPTLEGYLARIHKDDRKRIANAVQRAIKGNIYAEEFRVNADDGTIRWLAVRGHGFKDAEGNPDRMAGVLSDITERRIAQDRISFIAQLGVMLSESIDFESILKKIATIVVPSLGDWASVDILDDDGAIRNIAVCHVDKKKVEIVKEFQKRYPVEITSDRGLANVIRTGIPLTYPKITDELLVSLSVAEDQLEAGRALGLTSAIVVPLIARNRTFGALTLAHAESGRIYTDDDLKYVEVVARRFALAVDNAWLYKEAMREIEVRTQAEKELAELATVLSSQNSRLRDLLVTVPGVVWEAWGPPEAPTQKINFVSDYVETMLGYTVEEWINTPNFWLTIVHPDDQEKAAAEASAKFEKGGVGRSEFRWITKDGREIWVEATSVVILDDEGNKVGMRGVNIDTTERKRVEAELARFANELEERVKERTHDLELANSELEGFCYSVAHDLRTPLRNIVASSTMIMRDQRDRLDETAMVDLEDLVSSAKYLASLVDDLLRYARLGRQELNRDLVNFTALIHQVNREVEAAHPEAEIRLEVQSRLTVDGDPELLRMMLTNLLDNACKYRKADEPVRITIRKEGEVFSVSDSGIGFEMEFAEKLFEPFIRLHRNADYPGTGIGLANVKRIVERHGGKVWAEGRSGQGATFYFTLPRA